MTPPNDSTRRRDPAERPVVGLVPAAGRATRLGGFPCSKEVLPLGFSDAGSERPPVLASHGLLAAYREAGIERALFALGHGKWDVPAALGAGSTLGIDLGYVPVHDSRSVPESLDRLYPWLSGCDCALGFPDVWFRPEDAFSHLLAAHRGAAAEVTLGCFPTNRPQRTDMVELGESGEVLRIDVRPPRSELAFNWLLAVWSPAFTDFLHRQVAADREGAGGGELQLGEIFRRAHGDGMPMIGVPFEDGFFTDLGTRDELAEAWHRGHPLGD